MSIGKTQILQGKTQRFYWHPRLKTLLKLGRWDHLHKVTMQFSGVQRPLFQYAVSKSFKVLPNALILRHIQSPKYWKIIGRYFALWIKMTRELTCPWLDSLWKPAWVSCDCVTCHCVIEWWILKVCNHKIHFWMNTPHWSILVLW